VPSGDLVCDASVLVLAVLDSTGLGERSVRDAPDRPQLAVS
jgi:hypothetical protein